MQTKTITKWGLYPTKHVKINTFSFLGRKSGFIVSSLFVGGGGEVTKGESMRRQNVH